LTGTPSPPPSPPHTSCPDPKTLPSTTRLGGAEARRRKNFVPPVLTVLPTTGAHLLSLLLRLRPRREEVPLPGSPLLELLIHPLKTRSSTGSGPRTT
jgi:hypothetical protein